MTHPLFLAVDLDGDGAHPAAWRHSGRSPAQVFSAAALRQRVVSAQAAGFVLATFADTPHAPNNGPDRAEGLDAAGRIEAGTRAAFVAALTDRIGLAPTLHVTTTEPFHLATQLASLDHASRGRAAWVVGAANDVDSLATVGRAPLDPAALRQEVADVITAARLLWDSWQDDAVIKDVVTGRYLDPDRVHHIDFAGSGFTVMGPLITPRPPQGQVVVIAPGELEVDELADIVLVIGSDDATVASRAARARAAGAALVFADLEVVLDTPTRSAAERAAELDDATGWPSSGRRRHVGSVSDLLEQLTALGEIVDGVRLLPAVHAVDLPILADRVLPVLTAPRPRATGPGSTLRDRLGLPHPVNQFATA